MHELIYLYIYACRTTCIHTSYRKLAYKTTTHQKIQEKNSKITFKKRIKAELINYLLSCTLYLSCGNLSAKGVFEFSHTHTHTFFKSFISGERKKAALQQLTHYLSLTFLRLSSRDIACRE